jgi:hypothetical protein
MVYINIERVSIVEKQTKAACSAQKQRERRV